jgi:hypothetical protein
MKVINGMLFVCPESLIFRPFAPAFETYPFPISDNISDLKTMLEALTSSNRV